VSSAGAPNIAFLTCANDWNDWNDKEMFPLSCAAGTRRTKFAQNSKTMNESSDKHPMERCFPSQLFDMLEALEEKCQQDICSWLPHGRAFRVHKKTEFVHKVLPKYVLVKNESPNGP
jgi:HSF-type DNA-binding